MVKIDIILFKQIITLNTMRGKMLLCKKKSNITFFFRFLAL